MMTPGFFETPPLLTFITHSHSMNAANLSHSCIPQPPTLTPLLVVVERGPLRPCPISLLPHSSTHHSTSSVPFHLLCSSALKSSTSFINSLCTAPPGRLGSPCTGKCVWTLASVPRSWRGVVPAGGRTPAGRRRRPGGRGWSPSPPPHTAPPACRARQTPEVCPRLASTTWRDAWQGFYCYLLLISSF